MIRGGNSGATFCAHRPGCFCAYLEPAGNGGRGGPA
jgi:hypothetical protein